jgi:hypothetical protein
MAGLLGSFSSQYGLEFCIRYDTQTVSYLSPSLLFGEYQKYFPEGKCVAKV